MNEIQLFKNAEFGEIRTLTENGKPLFCGSDVARALGYAIPRKAVREHCRGGLKRNTPTTSGNQEMLFIPEGDVYRLIVRSKLPTAEKFEKWVFDEVLPTIRKTGTYQKPMTQAELIAAQAQVLVGFEKEINGLKIATAENSRRVDKVASLNEENWRNDIMERVKIVCEKQNILFTAFLGKAFKAVECDTKSDLAARVRNLRKRLKESGCTYKQAQAAAKIDAVAQDKKLRNAFEAFLLIYEIQD